MTWQYLTLSPLAPSESSHHTYHTYHAFVWVNRESFAKRTLLDMHMLYCSTHIFHCNTASPDVRAVGLPESIPDSLRDKHVHFTLTPTHNLESPIRRLMVFGLGEEPPCRVSALRLGLWEVLSLYIQWWICQSSHCGDLTNKTSSFFFSIFQLLSPE